MIVYQSLHEVVPPEKGAVVALGLFDGLHIGHRAVIGAAVEAAEREGLVPAVFTFSMDNAHPAAKTEAGRLYTSHMRERLFREMGVSLVLCPPFERFRGFSPREYVWELLGGILRAKYVFCGENYHFGKGAAATAEDLKNLCDEAGIEAKSLSLAYIGGSPVSSTRIRAYIADGDMPAAEKLLGRLFSYDFEVVHGRRLGHAMNMPTINQIIPAWFARPRFGVYASFTEVDGKRHISVTNVGYKPTIGSERLTSETYIHGFDGDLYGRRTTVELLRFIRPEQKFESIEALREQIVKDCSAAREICEEYLRDTSLLSK